MNSIFFCTVDDVKLNRQLIDELDLTLVLFPRHLIMKLIFTTHETEYSKHTEKGLVKSKQMWFIFVLTHVVSCGELSNELNQHMKSVRVTF